MLVPRLLPILMATVTVGISDFLLFVDVFGSSRGDGKYEAKYDLDGDGVIGIPDFLTFVDNFGKDSSSL